MNSFLKHLVKISATGVLLVASAWVISAGDAERGKSKVAVCSACHGAEGVSASSAFPNLAGQGEKYLTKQLKDIKTGERKVLQMTGMLAASSEQDLADIAAYYATKKAVTTGAQSLKDEAYALSEAEFLELGERVYRGGNLKTGVASCSGCHSPRGLGNAPAGYPAIAGQHADYAILQLKQFQNNLRKNDGEGKVMRNVAAPMSDLEIRAVANYIAGLQ